MGEDLWQANRGRFLCKLTSESLFQPDVGYGKFPFIL
jgi:hypothetical protein